MSFGRPLVQCSLRGRLGAYASSMKVHAIDRLGHAARMLRLGEEHELSLLLCDNAVIRRLNNRWRNIDTSTDVLSFPLHELQPGKAPPAGALGDIVISLPAARSAARARAVDGRTHLTCLVVHGLLHLLGHDHGTGSEKRIMRKKEEQLMNHLA